MQEIYINSEQAVAFHFFMKLFQPHYEIFGRTMGDIVKRLSRVGHSAMSSEWSDKMSESLHENQKYRK
jgi:hypothetical protein